MLYTVCVIKTRAKSIFLFLLITTAVVLVAFVVYIITDYFHTPSAMAEPSVDALYLDITKPIEERVADLLSYMTLEEKIGQMTLVEKDSIKEQGDIASYHIGAMLSGAGAKPPQNTPAGWREMIDSYQATAKLSRLGIPLLYGVDAIHGHAHVPTATVFPHAIGLGATNNPELVKEVANATAEELFTTGVNWSFSPNFDQPLDIRWGRVYEAFSDDPILVESLGVAYLEGLQSNVNLGDDKVFILATPKHYLGLGGMEWESSLNKNFKVDQGVTPSDMNLLRFRYLPPFKAAIDAGALSIMVGLNTWGDKRMVLQKELLSDLLKDELGFKGFLVSDWYGVHEGRKITFWATVQAINAGVDMVMLPFDYKSFARDVKWANRIGLISDERIDDAVGRILYAKFALGLFDGGREDLSSVSIPNTRHQILAREAVSESLVLLKNEEDILPLSPSIPYIQVAGSAAHNIGQQMGAWTIEWQGIDGNWPTEATSILEGIKAEVGPGVTVEYDLLGNFAKGKKARVGIAVVGEKPYAEGWGDKEYPTLSDEDLLAIKNLQKSVDKVVVIIVSGRPLFIADVIDSFDALVVAWLPGSEGAGVAEVLFGDKPFSGTLPINWPRNVSQLPIRPDGTTADGSSLLFPRYFGLE